MGYIGTIEGNERNPTVVRIAENQWKSFANLARLQENEIDKADGLVDAQVVMDELKIGKKTLANLICSGKISRNMYTVAPNGLKKFFIKKILGLEK